MNTTYTSERSAYVWDGSRFTCARWKLMRRPPRLRCEQKRGLPSKSSPTREFFIRKPVQRTKDCQTRRINWVRRCQSTRKQVLPPRVYFTFSGTSERHLANNQSGPCQEAKQSFYGYAVSRESDLRSKHENKQWMCLKRASGCWKFCLKSARENATAWQLPTGGRRSASPLQRR